MWLRPGVAVVWCRPAAAAPIRPLAQELPYATSADLKRKKILRIKMITYGKRDLYKEIKSTGYN